MSINTRLWFSLTIGVLLAASAIAAEQASVAPEVQFTRGIRSEAYPEIGYEQALRPQFHFTSKRNWLNDPNGMVFDGTAYHLFFQHNPKGTTWGNMTWGHAVSSDMVHWSQKDHALRPYRVDGVSGTIYSGTAVVDHNNSLGKQVGDTPTLCAFYTFATDDRKRDKYYQAMAYSTDRGESWVCWNDGRPVVPNQGFDDSERDPKVFWHEASRRWVMVLWVERHPGRVRFFTSKNLVDWEVASDLMRDWAFECMDLVFLPVDGDPSNVKCVLYDASFDYEIGEFDGRSFRSEGEALKQGRGNFYAAQTFNQAPDGRVVQIGWMRGGPNSAEAYGLPFNQQMSFPCELSLRTTPAGVRLFVYPVQEIESLVEATHAKSQISLGDGVNALAGIENLDLLDLSIDFDPGTASQIVFDLPGVRLRYNTDTSTLQHLARDKSGATRWVTTLDRLAPREGSVRIRLLVDRLTVEAYAFDGESFASHYFNPADGPSPASIHATGGSAMVRELVVRKLGSAW